jgi:hypothetical protein
MVLAEAIQVLDMGRILEQTAHPFVAGQPFPITVPRLKCELVHKMSTGHDRGLLYLIDRKRGVDIIEIYEF